MLFTWGQFRKKSEAVFQGLLCLWELSHYTSPIKNVKEVAKSITKTKNFKGFLGEYTNSS